MTYDPAVPKGKGSLILQMKRGVRAEYGDEELDALIAGCTPEARGIIGGVVLSSGFYPEWAIADLVRGVVLLVGKEAFPAYARQTAKHQMSSILKFLLRTFAAPKRFSDNNHKLWRANHDSGELTVTHGADDRSHIVVIKDFDFINPEYELASIEYHCGVLELIGAKSSRGVAVKSEPGHYVQEFTWET